MKRVTPNARSSTGRFRMVPPNNVNLLGHYCEQISTHIFSLSLPQNYIFKRKVILFFYQPVHASVHIVGLYGLFGVK